MPISTFVTHSHQSITNITTLISQSSEKTPKESSQVSSTKSIPESWSHSKSPPEPIQKD